jgi:hypothetical protein
MEADLKLVCDGQKIKSIIIQSTIDQYRTVLIQVQKEFVKLEKVDSMNMKERERGIKVHKESSAFFSILFSVWPNIWDTQSQEEVDLYS